MHWSVHLIQKTAFILFGGFILSMVGLYNGYPLVYSDTGTYIASGFNNIVPVDRPIAYGLFLEVTSMEYSTWLVILSQNLLTAFVLFEFLSVFFKNTSRHRLVFLSICFFLTAVSGIAWYSNQLMPDCFAPLLALSFFTLVSGQRIHLLSRAALLLILMLSLVVHFSHLLLGTAMVVLVLVSRLIIRRGFPSGSFRSVIAVSIFTLLGWLVLPYINHRVGDEFTLSKGSHVFLMGHLADTGILSNFLKENCSSEEFASCKLCTFKDSIPTDAAGFIWSGDILRETGGWEGSKDEYEKIISGTLTQPRYLFANIYKSVMYGLIQLTDNHIGHGLSSYNEGSAPHYQIQVEFGQEMNNYLNSRQNKWGGHNLNLDSVNTAHAFVLLLSLFVLILIMTTPVRKELKLAGVHFLWFALFVIVVNSFFTAGLNSPYGRLQTRVVWMLPLAVIILLVRNYTVILRHLASRLGESLKKETR